MQAMFHRGVRCALGVLACALLLSCGGRARNSGVDEVSAGDDSADVGGKSGGSKPSSGTAGGSASGSAGLRGGDPSSSSGGTSAASSGSTGGGNAGGATNGAGGTSAGGTAGAGTNAAAGGGSTGTADHSASVRKACGALCKEMSVCTDTGGGLGPSCQVECEDALLAGNGDCVEPGLEMSACLEQARSFNSDCLEAFFRAAQIQCGKQVTAYQECVAGNGDKQLPPLLCAEISYAASDSCTEDRKCLNSTWYNLKCTATGEGLSHCICQVHGDFIEDVMLTQVLSEPAAKACKSLLQGCIAAGFPGGG
jgi:hypothetical protein